MIQDVTKLCDFTAIYTSDGCLALKRDQEPLGSNSWLVCSCIDFINGGVEPKLLLVFFRTNVGSLSKK